MTRETRWCADAGTSGADGRVVSIPKNLVANPSFESMPDVAPWEIAGSWIGEGNVNTAADGRNNIRLAGTIAQDLATIPGMAYRVKLAVDRGGPSTNRIAVRFGSQVSEEFIFELSEWYWHWPEFFFTASNTTTRLVIESRGDLAGIDQVSVVPLNDPPQIVTQPQGGQVIAGSTARAGVY